MKPNPLFIIHVIHELITTRASAGLHHRPHNEYSAKANEWILMAMVANAVGNYPAVQKHSLHFGEQILLLGKKRRRRFSSRRRRSASHSRREANSRGRKWPSRWPSALERGDACKSRRWLVALTSGASWERKGQFGKVEYFWKFAARCRVEVG